MNRIFTFGEAAYPAYPAHPVNPVQYSFRRLMTRPVVCPAVKPNNSKVGILFHDLIRALQESSAP
jgi:hypothetical protein